MKKEKKLKMWEILVPPNDNDGNEFPLEHHQVWDAKVIEWTNGQTIMKTAKGRWMSPDNQLFHEPMIPVRVYCTKKTMKRIIRMTIEHYDQLAVMAYVISSEVLLVHRDEGA